MVKQLESDPHLTIYWIVRGINLLKTAPEHLRPVPMDDSGGWPGLSCSIGIAEHPEQRTTLYTEFTKTNKKQRHEISNVEKDEEFDHDEQVDREPEAEVNPSLTNYWQINNDQKI